MFVCAGLIETFSFASPIGIGLTKSAVALTELVLKRNPSSLVFVGSAGSYDPNIPLFSLHESTHGAQIELSFLRSDSYTPIDNVIALEEEQEPSKPPIIVNSSNYITQNPTLSKRLCDLGIQLENMEFYAVLEVARHFRLPAKGIFCVTNYTNEKAHSTFLQHHAKAMQRIETYIKEQYAQYL